jgi:two-component system sensor histidine kinase YesM
VYDDGDGITEEKIKEIFETTNTKDSFLHIGLKNIHDRIVLSFGAEYGLNIERPQYGGTRVIIKIPAIRREESDV